MSCASRIPVFGRLSLLTACLLLATAACSKPGQEAPPPAGSQPATAAGGDAAAPAATAGQPAATAPAAAAPAREVVPPPPPPPRTFTLAAGTVLSVRTNHTLTTDKQSAGDKFEASLAQPIVDGDWVIAREGAPVEGLVVASTKGGRVKGTAEIEVAVTGLTLSDGQNIRLETAMATAAAKSEAKKDVGKVAITTGAGALIGGLAGGGKGAAIGAAVGGAGGTAVVLGTRGKAAEIPAGSTLRFQLKKPVEITEKK